MTSCFQLFITSFLVMFPDSAAKPATNPPIIPVTIMIKIGLSICKIRRLSLWENKSLLPLLMIRLRLAHKRKRARKPVKKDRIFFCGIKNVTTNAAMAIHHQGKNSDSANESAAMQRMEMTNFILQF